MFIKIVIVLLLLIVAASLLTGRKLPGEKTASSPVPASRIRPLMLRVAIVLLLLGTTLALFHLLG
jgi:hypothetical protein